MDKEIDLQRRITKKLVIEFAENVKINEINDLSKKMLNTLSVDEAVNIITCKVEQTIMYVEKTLEEFEKEEKKKDVD